MNRNVTSPAHRVRLLCLFSTTVVSKTLGAVLDPGVAVDSFCCHWEDAGQFRSQVLEELNAQIQATHQQLECLSPKTWIPFGNATVSLHMFT
jgi:hypothetical protein